MKKSNRPALSRREREIMDILYKSGRATAAEVLNDLSGEPHYSTVRTQLRVLEGKGYVRHEEENLRYVYVPAVAQDEVGRSALKQLIDGLEGSRLSQKKLDRIAAMIDKARKEAKQ
jgi:BlaI family transcriptional regulator, penicillinase repressor